MLCSGGKLESRSSYSRVSDYAGDNLESRPKEKARNQGNARKVPRGWLPIYVFDPSSFSKTLKIINSVIGSDVWPTMKAALHAFRRAMRSTTREDAIIHFWTACEVIAAAGDRKPRDAEAAQAMKRIFKRTWYEFPDQIDGFLNLRNKILHEAASEVQWHHVYFSHFLFERLFGLLLWYSYKKKKQLAQIRALFKVAKLDRREARQLLEALQESGKT